MTDKELQKLSRIVEQDLPALAKNIIVPADRGYDVFGVYRIVKNKGLHRVEKYCSCVGEFSQMRTALSWCVADKYQQHRLADDILKLDKKQQILSNDLHARNRIAQNIQSSMRKESIKTKVDRKRHMLEDIRFRLDKCINLAKYWQLRGFNNETPRTGRTSSQRTSR